MASYDFLDDTGIIVADTTDTLAEVQQEYRDAFNKPDLVVDASTPQGALITAETLARDNQLRNNAVVANQINPNQAGGVFLDAIWALTGGERFRENSSLVQGVTVTGIAGVTLPRFSQASVGPGGEVFETLGDVEFGADGTAVVDFQSVNLGPIAAPAGDLNTIVSGVLGWETVTNPSAAILGQAEENDGPARTRRRNTLALQGVALDEAIKSGLYATPGVRSAQVYENYTDADEVVDGITVFKNSIYSCVEGGADNDVAMALYRKKSLGCNWTGTEAVDVVSPASGQTYHVKFDRPTEVPIYIIVNVRAGSAVGDPQAAVRAAIVAYASGEDPGESLLGVSDDVSAFELAGAVNAFAVGLFVQSLFIGTAPAPATSNTIAIAINQVAQIIEGNIQVNTV